MAKIKNWSRKQSLERRTRPYVWKHLKTGFRVEVTELGSGEYRVKLLRDRQETLMTMPTQEKARTWAVNWMRRHTQPSDFQDIGSSSKGNPSQRRSRANVGR